MVLFEMLQGYKSEKTCILAWYRDRYHELTILGETFQGNHMSPGIGLMKRRLEKEKDAIALAISGVAKGYDAKPEHIKTLETKYHADSGDWYVALGWDEKRAIVRMDSVLGTVTEIKEI